MKLFWNGWRIVVRKLPRGPHETPTPAAQANEGTEHSRDGINTANRRHLAERRTEDDGA